VPVPSNLTPEEKRNLKKDFKACDFVSFHTQFGESTGIIQYIEQLGPDKEQKDKWFRHAVILVHETTFKVRTYKRPLFKLKHLI